MSPIPEGPTLKRGKTTAGSPPQSVAVKPPVDPIASACTLPRVWFGFVGQAFERSVVGFVVWLGLLRIGISLLLMFVPTTHALRLSADRHQADGECKKHNCRCAAFHVRTCSPGPTPARSSPVRTVD